MVPIGKSNFILSRGRFERPGMRRNMYLFNRLTAIVLTAVLLGPTLPLEARTKKGDKYLTEGRLHEQKKEWDAAAASHSFFCSWSRPSVRYLSPLLGLASSGSVGPSSAAVSMIAVKRLKRYLSLIHI